MPVIQLTEADRLQTKVMEKGVYKMALVDFSNATASKNGNSINYVAKFRVVEGPFLNKELSIMYNTKANANSMLGTLQMAPTSELLKLQAAALGQKLDDVALNFDSDQVKDKPMDAVIGVETSEGNIINMIVSFAPTGSATAVGW